MVIAGILAAVAIPMMTGDTKKAIRAEAIATLGFISAAERLYAFDYGGSYCAVNAGAFDNTAGINQYIQSSDLQGKHYNAGNYRVDSGGNIFAGDVGYGAVSMDVNGNLNQ